MRRTLKENALTFSRWTRSYPHRDWWSALCCCTPRRSCPEPIGSACPAGPTSSSSTVAMAPGTCRSPCAFPSFRTSCVCPWSQRYHHPETDGAWVWCCYRRCDGRHSMSADSPGYPADSWKGEWFFSNYPSFDFWPDYVIWMLFELLSTERMTEIDSETRIEAN